MAWITNETEKMKSHILGAWNAGLTLSETFTRLSERHGLEDKRFLIAEWRDLKRKFGCKSVPLWYLMGEVGPRKPSQEELNTIVGPFGTYGDWKGITGPGAQLREVIHEEK